jgi:NAD(P)-dependent dehydrogenase (short-subunit alcohol dehydrogenase family)
MTELRGKRVLVTGASRNLGAAIVERLAQAEMSVAVNYRTSKSAAEELVDRLESNTGRAHVAVAGDMGDAFEAQDAVRTAIDGLGGPIDILVNNAGPFAIAPFAELAEEEWDRVWDANVKAVYLTVREVAPAMKAAGWGRIVNVSAVSAYVRNRSIYGLSKQAVITLTEQLALELAPEVTVNAVAPGQIEESVGELAEFSPEWAEQVRSRTPAGRLVRRADIAEIVYLLCTDAFDMVTGVTIPVEGGLRLPRF